MVPLIGKLPIEGASTATNEPVPDPVANPLGRADTVSMYARYSSFESKSGRVVGVSLEAVEVDISMPRSKAGWDADVVGRTVNARHDVGQRIIKDIIE